MDQQKIPGKNDPANAMNNKEAVQSNDRKLKQDFPGYPHNPASESEMKEEKNWRTDFSNENDTTATGSESVRGDQRPSEDENRFDENERQFLSENDRGLTMHEEDADDVENNDKKS